VLIAVSSRRVEKHGNLEPLLEVVFIIEIKLNNLLFIIRNSRINEFFSKGTGVVVNGRQGSRIVYIRYDSDKETGDKQKGNKRIKNFVCP